MSKRDQRHESARMGRRFMGRGLKACVIVGVVLIVCCCGPHYYSFGTEADVTITVTDKERVGSRYLIFTDDEVFETTDAPFHGKFDSSDRYNALDEGETYTCSVNGMRLRVPIFSRYRNLLTCSPVGS